MHVVQKRPGHFFAGILIGAIGMLALLFLGALVVATTGAYDVAARSGHTAPMRWLLDTSMRSSVDRRAPDTPATRAPADDAVACGAGEYKAMCEHCHGAPGVDPAEWSHGMLPRPPDLMHAATEWQDSEIFWIVGHGLKFTGMPAFGETHDDSTLWDIAHFVSRLPAMTPEQYAAFPAGHGHDQGGGHGGDHPHGTGRAGAPDGAAGKPSGARSRAEPDDEHDHDH
jgi:mono/diheme cytochrome c family protein